eukprot:PhF_6_TR30757/c0_g2_i1/m.45296
MGSSCCSVQQSQVTELKTTTLMSLAEGSRLASSSTGSRQTSWSNGSGGSWQCAHDFYNFNLTAVPGDNDESSSTGSSNSGGPGLIMGNVLNQQPSTITTIPWWEEIKWPNM